LTIFIKNGIFQNMAEIFESIADYYVNKNRTCRSLPWADLLPVEEPDGDIADLEEVIIQESYGNANDFGKLLGLHNRNLHDAFQVQPNASRGEVYLDRNAGIRVAKLPQPAPARRQILEVVPYFRSVTSRAGLHFQASGGPERSRPLDDIEVILRSSTPKMKGRGERRFERYGDSLRAEIVKSRRFSIVLSAVIDKIEV
jgi:hypothetical protein